MNKNKSTKMNWIILLMLLQIISFSRSAPVSDLGNTDIFNTLTTEANNLTKTSEIEANTTEIAFDVINSQSFPQKLENSLLDEQKKHLETQNEKNSAETNTFENNENEHEDSFTTSQNPTENVQQGISYTSNVDEFNSADFTTVTPLFVTTGTMVMDLDLENVTAENIEQHKELTTFAANEVQGSFSTKDSNNFEAEGSDQQDTTSKQAVDFIVADVLEIDNKLDFLPNASESVKPQTSTKIPEEEIQTKAGISIEKSLVNDLKQTVDKLANQTQNSIKLNTEIYTKSGEDISTLHQATTGQDNINLNGVQTTFDEPITVTQESKIKDFTTVNSIQEVNDDKIASKQNPGTIDTTDHNTESKAANEVEYLQTQPLSFRLPNSTIQSKVNGDNTEETPFFKQPMNSFSTDVKEVGGDELGLNAPSTNKNVAASDEVVAEEMNPQTSAYENLQIQTNDPTTDVKASETTTESGNLQTTATSRINKEEIGSQSDLQIEMASSILENVNETLNESLEKSHENLVEKTGRNLFKSVTDSLPTSVPIFVPTLDNQQENFTQEISSEVQGIESLEKNFISLPTLAHYPEANTKTSNEDHLINEVLGTISGTTETTEISPANTQTFKENTETPSNKSGVTENSQAYFNLQIEHAKNNYHTQSEESQSETVTTRQQPENKSDFDSTQPHYQTEANNNNETSEKLNAIKQLDTTAAVEILENPTSKLNERIDETTESINDLPVNMGFTTESHKLDSTVPLVHLAFLENNESTQNNQYEFSAPVPIELLATATESTTLVSVTATTTKTQNFEEELKTAVKTLEETTHHQLEEFQNNLKQAFQKFNALETEKKLFQLNATTTENPHKQLFTTTANNDMSTAVEGSEELHRSGIIRHNFIDKFADSYNENFNASISSKEQQLQQLEKSASNLEILRTTLPSVENLEAKTGEIEYNEEHTTARNDITEAIILTESASILGEESSRQPEPATTEYISETTTEPNLVRVTLLKDWNSFKINLTEVPAVTEATIQETTTQTPELNAMQQTDFSAAKYTEPEEETTALPVLDSLLKEMVTFIERNASTTENTAALQEQNHETQTLYNSMQKQQHYSESTTEHTAQIESTDSSDQTATTTNHNARKTEPQTTEAEIYSTTTEVEENETTVTPIELEARSLSLTPPKLEHLQTDEGVEVFYGYSIVKHN